MSRLQSKTKKRLIIASCLATGVAALGIGAITSASAGPSFQATGKTYNEAQANGRNQCTAAGYFRGHEEGKPQQNPDGSWTITMVCQ
jgi:hypothetical protein